MLNDVFVIDAICHAYNFARKIVSANLMPTGFLRAFTTCTWRSHRRTEVAPDFGTGG